MSKPDLVALYRRHKQMILYFIFGGLTTLINIVSYALCRSVLKIPLVPADILAWLLSVLFAYVTNKRFGFESRSWRRKVILREMTSFFVARLFSLGVDVVFLYLTVTVLGWWELLMKVLANGIVIVLNYVFSKLIIFRKDTAAKQPKG